MDQFVIGLTKESSRQVSIWADAKSTILYLSILSVALLAVRGVLLSVSSLRRVRRKLGLEEEEIEWSDLSVDAPGYDSGILKASEARARWIQSSRLVVCFALFSLTGYLYFHEHGSHVEGRVLIVCYVYACSLALGTVLAPVLWRRVASQHLSLILLGEFCVYVYRDVAPLARKHYGMDRGDGWLAVLRLALLFIGGIWTPVTLPRPYWPVDPSKPITPSAEQTASWLSRATFSYVDEIVWRANKSTTLDMEDLPPLPDAYYSRHLAATAFPHLDPVLLGRTRHLFWGIASHFKILYLQQFMLMSLEVVNEFASPTATYMLLSYIEADEKQGLIQPWVWILWLGFGPAIASVCQQAYLYLTTVVFVQVEAILTQLIFEHSLRIRVNSHLTKSKESDNSKSGTSNATSVQTTPTIASSAASVIGGGSGDSSEEGIIAVSSSQVTGSTVVSETADVKTGKSKKGPANTAQKIEDQSGKLMTMVTSDIKQLQLGSDWFAPFFFLVRIAVCIAFLYRLLGWSAIVGIGFIVITFPLPGSVAKLLMSIQEVKMKKTDARIQNITQIMNVLRMIKLFAWEDKVKAQIAEKREDELHYIRNSELIDAANGALNSFLPLATMMVVYATYILVMGYELKASVVFPSAAVFGIFRNVVFHAFWNIPNLLRAKVSLDRIGEYLSGGELFEPPRQNAFAASDIVLTKKVPYLRDALFTWSKPGSGSHTPGRRNFHLHIDGELSFHEGKVNLICGPTGCGKTSLLMALLGEMYFNPSGPSSVSHLPRDGGIAYAAQEAWVINETIRQNILFQTPYEKERYEKVLYQVGLERDLDLLDAGDMTEVGEKGLTLSGGQKARITLARAVYSKAQILLLDDVLSALDVHTARWVTEKCLGGDLLEGRTVLLVTHNVVLAEEISDFVVVLGLDGRVTSQGSMSEALKSDSRLRRDAKKQAAKVAAVDEKPEGEKVEKSVGKLIVKEEMGIGHISWSAAKFYLVSLGGIFFWMFIIPCFVTTAIIPILENWFLGYWSSQYELHPGEPLPVKRYLLFYGLILLSDTLITGIAQMVFILGVVRASRKLHADLINSVLASTFRWLDTVPISRVITRFSQDCQTIDGFFGQLMVFTTQMVMNVIISFITVIVSAGWPAIPPAIIVAIVVVSCAHLYINAQMPIKRSMSNNRAPILGQLANVLNGIVSVRAYDAQMNFRDESLRRIDVYTRTAVNYWNLNRWIGFRMDAIGGFFGGVVAAWLIYGQTIPAGSVGFTLTIISNFSSCLLGCIRLVNETEVQANSVERIQQYLEIEHEEEPSDEGNPPAYWPSSGDLRVENLTARYSADGPVVLNGLSFHVKSGERVGIVGRTGAGKSTIANALLRAIPIEGSVFFDDRQTGSINLSALRSNITIIPQHPELLNGTLRDNLDPFGEHDDAILNSALHSAGLSRLQQEDGEEGKITLETDLQAGGSNFSQGQRQILALARAMVRRSKLLILDEATAAIDFETDQAIQQSLRTELHDVTLLTVAHRLKTIMDYDKIMVLDAGSLIEFDTPKALLSKKTGLFYHLVEESSDRDELYRLAGL